MTPADAVLGAAAVPVCVVTGYLVMLLLFSGPIPPPPPSNRRWRFVVIVPAHDEARGIGATISSLAALDYPRELFRILVVADNCSDSTAEVARRAGVTVLVRTDARRRGKGYALALAFDQLLSDSSADAFVVVDADTLASANLLCVFSDHLDAGAEAVQADYTIRNARASWRTSLLAVAFAASHRLRSLARERLRVSCCLRGNGMCFSARLLAAVPYDAVSIVEDLEYTIRLGFAGVRVAYAAGAQVFSDMPTTERHSRSQRRRWEAGRAQMARIHAGKLLLLGLAKRSRVPLDLGADLLVPPLASLALATGAGLLLSVLASCHAGHVTLGAVPWVASVVGLTMYVLRGWQLSGTGVHGLMRLGLAPLYVAWKVALRLRPSAAASGEWVRTTREGSREDDGR